jgi:hypothetical protein
MFWGFHIRDDFRDETPGLKQLLYQATSLVPLIAAVQRAGSVCRRIGPLALTQRLCLIAPNCRTRTIRSELTFVLLET